LTDMPPTIRPEYKSMSIGLIHYGLFRLSPDSAWRCVHGYDGKKTRFNSTHDAVKAARGVIEKLTEEKIVSACPDISQTPLPGLDVEQWRRDKAAELEALKSVFSGGSRSFAVESRHIRRRGLTPTLGGTKSQSGSAAGGRTKP
jgi:hypothetical protein